jgi:hypothetical protein
MATLSLSAHPGRSVNRACSSIDRLLYLSLTRVAISKMWWSLYVLSAQKMFPKPPRTQIHGVEFWRSGQPVLAVNRDMHQSQKPHVLKYFHVETRLSLSLQPGRQRPISNTKYVAEVFFSSDTLFIPIFMKIRQLVQKLKTENTHSHK